MRLRFRYVAVLIGAVTMGACRQADGPIPTPNETVQAELVDVRRDLQNVASSRDPEASNDLAADLRKYAQRQSAKPAVEELSRRAASVLAGKNLPDQTAQQLAHDLWLSIAAREISERQVETLQNDVQSILMSIGVAEEGARQVAAQVGAVQSAGTDRPRRWYELF
jgi:hypothetical protein